MVLLRHTPPSDRFLCVMPLGGAVENLNMKRSMFLLSAVAVLCSCLFSSCEEVIEKECDKQHYENEECDKEHLPETVPSVTLTAGTVTTESVSFVITPSLAASVRYSVVAADAVLPDVESLFNKDSESFGLPADAVISDEYTVSGLTLGTDYVVVAAASNNVGYSELTTVEMTTAIPEMSLELSVVRENANSVVFSISPVNASKVAYQVLAQGESLPDAKSVLESGVEVDAASAGQYTVKGLDPETSYTVVAAALDLAGKNAMLSDALVVTTTAVVPPVVGDYYYSDGTWSTEYDESRTPIGVVFYLGCATDFKDNVSWYKIKDGSAPMEEFHGYVVALKDASPEEGVWWSFYDGWDDGAGCSNELEDFLGYTNTQSIKSTAAGREAGFTAENDSYPAAYYATVVFEEVCPAPEQSSGWFLPSAYQFKYLWDKVYFNPDGNLRGWVENSLRNLGDLAEEMYVPDSSYWTSTEKYDSYGDSCKAYYFNFDYSSWSPGFIDWYGKDEEFRVRSMLAF